LKNHVSILALYVVAGSGVASVPAFAACTADASHAVTCTGINTAPFTIYDQAAAFQPTAGSNTYVPANPSFPAASNPDNPGYNPNPATAFLTIASGATFTSPTITAANRTTALADGGLIVANYSNTENPAVNNVTVTNAGTVTLTNGQFTNRASAIVADSQVNTFTVNNSGVVTAAQTGLGATFNSANLFNTASAATTTAPPVYTARYLSPTAAFAITSALYSDDNTNEFVLNNTGVVTATGHFAAAYYGRADTTINNSGVLGNTDYATGDKIYAGHWAIATFAGADFATVAGSNPDTPLYDVENIAVNAQGYRQGTLAVTDTSATTLTNNAGGTIAGDILVLDTSPLITAAAAAKNQALPLATTGANSGPRDSNIQNNGTIDGNFYLGSGTHVIDNAAGATITGAINVDQRASVGSFATGVVGTVAGTYLSAGPGTTSSTGGACPTAGTNTTDPYCARTSNVLASFVGGQSLTLTNEGTLGGDITIIDQATSSNVISLTGTGFAGNVVAVNGTGSNSLVLDGVTNLTSVQNFSSLDLMQSQVTVANGVSLVDGSTLKTTIFGPGGTAAAPSSSTIGSITGTLTSAGTTTIVPTLAAPVLNGVTYQIASAATGTFVTTGGTALVSTTASDANGPLTLTTSVRDAFTVPGITRPGAQTIDGLTGYTGTNAQVQALDLIVESLGSDAAVAQAGRALSPIVNGADVQTPINSTMLFHQQIDSRLDQYVYGQIPVAGRSAALGVPRPVEIYGGIPRDGSWIEGIGGGVHQGTLAGVGGYTAQLVGAIGGYDRLVTPTLKLGVALGYIDATVNENSVAANHERIQTYQGLVYAEFAPGAYYLRASAGYGGVDYDSERQISFAGFSDIANATHDGNILTVRGEGGVPYVYANSLIVPYAAFTYFHLTQDAYTEQSGAGAGLGYGAATNDSERGEVGGKIIVPLTGTPVFSFLFPAASSLIALEARAAYVREFGTVGQVVTAAFGGGTFFTVAGPVPNRDMIDFGVGVKMASGPVQIDLSYNGLERSTYLEQVGLLRARYVF
jgi:uncharacterized protein with beta-barrel porin domain